VLFALNHPQGARNSAAPFCELPESNSLLEAASRVLPKGTRCCTQAARAALKQGAHLSALLIALRLKDLTTNSQIDSHAALQDMRGVAEDVNINQQQGPGLWKPKRGMAARRRPSQR
jgi:hypothetical protein